MSGNTQQLKKWLGQKVQKSVAVVALFSVLVTGPLPVLGLPVEVVFDAQALKEDITQFIKEGLKTSAQVGVKNATRAFLEKLAYDAAVSLTSGCEYQGPCINFKSPNVGIADAADAATGEFLNTLATQNGFINLNLCNLPEHEKLELTLLLPKLTGKAPYEPSCSLSEIRAEVGDYSNDLQLLASTLLDDPASLATLSIGVMEGENALSSLLALVDEQTEAETEAERGETLLQLKSDFTAIESPISGYIKTPASVLEMQTQVQYAQAAEAELTFTGNPIADALSVFSNTLSKRLLDQTTSGLLGFFTEADLNETIANGGSSSFSSSTSGSAKAARERFANLQTPSFTTGGQLDVLNEFTNCPEVGVTSNNCVIGQDFRRAIEEKMTIRQAMDEANGPLISRDMSFVIDSNGTPIEDFEQGLNKRSIAILVSQGVLPATVMVAAEYNEQYDGTALSLGQLADAYTDTTSPYFGLFDPDWVLKAPEVFCKVQGYGETLTFDEFADTDGNPDTPQEHLVSRLDSCVDEQTCLSEDDNGNCEAYGYCTKYEDRYRFSGEECPSYYASCQGYENSDGDRFSVLTNTVNSGDCSESNAGCQWVCTVYNDVDETFQCAGQDSVYETCETDEGCACTSDSGQTCTIENGGFFCTTDGGEECTTGTVDEASIEVDAAISFDNSVTECQDDEAGCSEFIPVKDGGNLVLNNSFESFNDERDPTDEDLSAIGTATDTPADFPYDDTFGFYGSTGDGVDATLAGDACSGVTESHTCFGWELDGASARAVNNAIDGSAALQLAEGTGNAQMRLDTGQSLANRTFTLNFSYMNPTSDSCTGQYWVAPDGDSATYAVDIDYGTNASAYATEFADTVTFPDSATATTIEVGFSQPTGCDIVIDAVTMVEAAGSPGSIAYGDSSRLEYVNINDANECTPDEIGCTEFTPRSGESDFVITGQITNPLSEACGNGEDFTDPSCSQCVEEFVGCDAYIELETPFDSPIKDVTHFTSAPSAELASAIAQRTGNYCDGTTTACNSDADCETSVQCLPSISIVPDQADSCTANAVGCEEYVNLDAVAQGGEGTEYYTFTQQCVKETQDQIDDEAIDFFYSFESTESGYQLRSHYLKVSDDGSGAPCSNLDHYDLTGTAETTEADCVDSTLGSEECDPSDNADCIEYYDADLNTYYRLQSEVIQVSEQCILARNSLDDRLYSILPEESTQCGASQNLCREYQGSEGGSARTLIEEDFESEVWDGGTSSAESLSVDTGLSMLVASGSPASVDVSGLLQEDQNYVIQFWAKGDGGNLDVYFASGATEVTFLEGGTVIGDDWQLYKLGPVVLENGLVGDEALEFAYDSAELYIDNVVVSESESHYLLADTLVTCNGYEGCEEYDDQNGNTEYLKSFTGLCEDDAVGCEALIDTHQDADNPFYTLHNNDNEFTEDDVPVDTHQVVTYTVTSDSRCDAEVAGCGEFGEPSFDAYENISALSEYSTTTFLNDPDTYDETLCQEQERWCDAWTENDGESVTYAKNFGERYCEYDSSSGQWVTSEGDPCPLQNENDTPSQPRGPVCNGGDRLGELCSTDSDCPATDADSNSYRCVSNLSDSVGWAGLCSDAYNECTLYLDPNGETEVPNDSMELDNYRNDDYSVVEEDDNPDYWDQLNEAETGTADASGAGGSYQSSDVVNMSSNRAPDSKISIWHEDDFARFSQNTSGSLNESGSFTDQDGGNPTSTNGTLVGMSSTNWSGMSNSVDIRLETDNTADSVISFTFPSLSQSVLDQRYLMFHLADNGNLYWADAEHDGIQTNRTDYLSPTEAMTSEHLVSVYDGSGEPIEINAFYDAEDFSTEVLCNQFERVPGDEAFSGQYGLALRATNETCMAGSNSLIPVDTNSVYTLAAKIYPESTDTHFALGLLYYDVEGNEINAGADSKHYAFAAYEGPNRDSDESFPSNTWIHYHGEIGPNLETQFPEGTYFVRVFVEAGPEADIQVDDVNFNKNEEYTYIENTVDTTSCNGEQDAANGCVALRNTGNDALSYLSDAASLDAGGITYAVESCTFDSPVENAACRARAYAADTNNVILVDQDRECSEWLGCTEQEDIYNDSGELESVVCSDVGLCTQRNEETGVCTEWSDDKSTADLQDRDALSTDLSIGTALALGDLQNMSGHSKIGATWDTGACSSGECTAGDIGAACSNDSDCDPQVSGFYPYNWMPYLGLGGSLSTTPIINNGDFEEVYCDGRATSSYAGLSDASRQRNRELSCTVDSHCRTITTDAAVETYEATAGGSTEIDSIGYEDGWCANIEANSWTDQGNDWTTNNAEITIIDYSPGESDRIFDANIGVSFEALTEGVAGGVGAGSVDLDNYLYVLPSANERSFVEVEIEPGRILDGQEYTVQFNAGHTVAPGEDDLLEVVMIHGDGDVPVTPDLEDTDVFVQDTDGMQMEQGVKSYTFGPITANKSDNTESTTLIIGLGPDNEGTGFVLDDVQVAATLAVNGDGNEITGQDQLIGRQCRAYPEQDSLQCSYTDVVNDTIHQGWQGFCTVKDPFDSSKCITWFPVDSIPGEPNFASADLMFWSGHFPVYHCLAAKGNEKLGACSDSGVMCLDDGDCAGAGTCYGGNDANDVEIDAGRSSSLSPSQTFNVESNSYTTTISADQLFVDSSSHIGGQNNNEEQATFIKLDQDSIPTLKNIHISEIDNLSINIGQPIVSPKDSRHPDAYELYTAGAVTTFDMTAMEQANADGYNMFNQGNGNTIGVPITRSRTEDLRWVYQRGVWCNEEEDGADGLCDDSADVRNNIDDLGFYFVKAVTADGTPGTVLTQADGVWNGGFPLNPFLRFDELEKTSSIWSNNDSGSQHAHIDEISSSSTDSLVEGLTFDGNYFFSRWQDGAYSCWGRPSVGCGANIAAYYVDFEDGYIDGIYIMYWDGIHEVDTTWMKDVAVTIDLREACLAAAETVDSDANTTPWWTRAQSGTAYTLDDIGYGYQMENNNSLYGRMDDHPEDDGLEDAMSDSANTFEDFTVAASADSGYANLPFVYQSEASMKPMACIGACGDLICEGDRGLNYEQDPACSGDRWIGGGGICDNGAGVCNDDTDCDGGTCAVPLSNGDGVGSDTSTYLDQLNKATNAGWDRLNLVFADLSPNRNIWFADVDATLERYEGFLTDLSDTDQTITDFCADGDCDAFDRRSEFDFDAMDECPGVPGDNEYCGERPAVTGLELNNNDSGSIELAHGQIATMRFSTNTNNDQEPVQTVMIDWEAAEGGGFNDSGNVVPHTRGTADGDMSYSHVYTCDPAQGDTVIGASEDPSYPYIHCLYKVRVQIQDNWDFCSGSQDTGDVRGDDCTSYDQYSGNIIVRP